MKARPKNNPLKEGAFAPPMPVDEKTLDYSVLYQQQTVLREYNDPNRRKFAKEPKEKDEKYSYSPQQFEQQLFILLNKLDDWGRPSQSNNIQTLKNKLFTEAFSGKQPNS